MFFFGAFLQGSCRTRDRCGEPLATSYHSKFMGTVDYIWYVFFSFWLVAYLVFRWGVKGTASLFALK